MTSFHMGISVRGSLHKSDRQLLRDWRNAIRGDDGEILRTAMEIREAFMAQLALGREVIPFGDPCDAWDYATGCRGHRTADAGTATLALDVDGRPVNTLIEGVHAVADAVKP